MNHVEVTNPHFRVLSSLPGRVRFEVRLILKKPAMAQAVVRGMKEQPLVNSVKANAWSGSVLVEFSPEAGDDDLQRWILEALGQATEAEVNGTKRERKSESTAVAVRKEDAPVAPPSPLQRLLDTTAKYPDLRRRAMAACLAAGGTVTHHHGVGLLKADAYRAERASAIGLIDRLTAVLDPAGILNPGKMGSPTSSAPNFRKCHQIRG